MNVSANAAPADEAPEPAHGGELVVHTGRMKGVRRPLVNPLTLIGQAPSCEVRLNVDGVQPLHCAIAHTPEGYVLRDLTGDRAVMVNGQKVSVQLLKDGDLLDIGPFQFAAAIPEAMRPEAIRRAAAASKNERDALRIQAAAVASQQAGLTEEEIRLEQRRVALQHQEEQLSARLDERQGELREREEQLRRDREALQEERAAEDRRQSQARAELAQARSDCEQKAGQAVAERRRLAQLRQRLKRRWQQQLQVQKADMERRDKALAATKVRLQTATGNLEREQQKLIEDRLRLNGEMELGRRQLQEEWQELGLAQQHWEAALNQEQVDQARRLHALEERLAAVARAESELAKERQFWQEHRTGLEKDIEGLEQRVRHHRQKLAEVEQQLARTGTAGQPIPGPSVSGPSPQIATMEAGTTGLVLSEAVQRVAGAVADQRWHLIEQWERLLRAQDDWDQERAVVVQELEDAAGRLQQREQQLETRVEQVRRQEALVEASVGQMQQRQESLSKLRCSLEGWQARMQVRHTAWEAEREEVLSAVRAREEALAAQLFRAEELHRKRTTRLKQQFQALRKARQRCDEVRLRYAALWTAARQQHKSLLAEQQGVARQTLALERFRAERLGQVGDAVTAEKKLEKLQHDCEALGADADRVREREWQALRTEMARLDEQTKALTGKEKDLLDRTEALTAQLTTVDDRQAALAQSESGWQQQVQREQARYRLAEEQIHKLREEVERMAQMLLEEVDAGLLPAVPNQAA